MSVSRISSSSIGFVDDYCQLFVDLFLQHRSYEAFKCLHLGMISEVKRKSLPAIAKVVGLENHQSLHHFLTESPWMASQLCQRRLDLVLEDFLTLTFSRCSSFCQLKKLKSVDCEANVHGTAFD